MRKTTTATGMKASASWGMDIVATFTFEDLLAAGIQSNANRIAIARWAGSTRVVGARPAGDAG